MSEWNRAVLLAQASRPGRRPAALDVWFSFSFLIVVTFATGCSANEDSSSAEGTTRRLSGQIAALQGASARAYADIEAVSLIDASIADSVASTADRFELQVPPGPYLLVVRTAGAGAEGDQLTVSGTIDVGDADFTLIAPLAIAFRWMPVPGQPSAATSGTVIGVVPIPMTGPPGLGLGPNAAGPLTTGLVDPCREKGGKVVDLDPEVLDAIAREQQLSDSGQLANPLNVQPIPATLVVQGSVTVGAGGIPSVDLSVTDASTGELVRHVMLRGEPSDGEDIGPFLRAIGKGLAEDLCPEEPTPTPQSTATVGATEAPGGLTITYSGTFTMTNQAVPQRTPPSYTYRVDWTYTWSGTWEQLFADDRTSSDQTLFQDVRIAGTVDATYRDKVDGPDINCTISIAPDPAQIPSFIAYYDTSEGTLRISNVDAPTFRLGMFVNSSDPNCNGGPGVDVFSAPADWSPLGDGGGSFSLNDGGTHTFDKQWKWQHPFAGGEARNYDAAMNTNLEVAFGE
jgi:hypothetical protein